MVRITKVYTRAGDQGNTTLVGGRKVSKTHLRVEAYGTVDELNCALGMVRSLNRQGAASDRQAGLERLLQMLQQRLFDVGAELATHPEDAGRHGVTVTEADVQWMEGVIDTLNAELPPLTSFVLPGGGTLNASLHQARAVCRRTERLVTRLADSEGVSGQVLPFLNRLSDLLFVLSRWCAANLGEEEWLWEPGQSLDDSWRTW